MLRITGKDMGIHDKSDWVYSDLPNMTKEHYDQYVSLIGEENIHWLTQAERKWPDGKVTYRGQHLISPTGMINRKTYVETMEKE